VQHQVGQITLGVQDNCRDIMEGCLLEKDDTQTGFTRTGHTGDDGVSGQVGRVQFNILFLQLAGSKIKQPPNVEVGRCHEEFLSIR